MLTSFTVIPPFYHRSRIPFSFLILLLRWFVPSMWSVVPSLPSKFAKREDVPIKSSPSFNSNRSSILVFNLCRFYINCTIFKSFCLLQPFHFKIYCVDQAFCILISPRVGYNCNLLNKIRTYLLWSCSLIVSARPIFI